MLTISLAGDVILTEWFIFELAWLTLAILAAGHAIVYKRDPKSASLWIFIVFTVPILGAWFYWAFGINRVERRALKRHARRDYALSAPPSIGEHAADEHEARVIGHLSPLRRVGDRITRLPLLAGNQIEPLHNGEQAYPAMIEAIQSAQRSVTLASYIFDWDEMGRRFTEALAESASRGVAVHVLVDGIGALGNFSRMGRKLLSAGVEVVPFAPLRFPFGRIRVNLRNHRKILVVDGTTGFTGGMNISARHMMMSSDPKRVEDLHFRLTGPIVTKLQQAFVDDWTLCSDRLLEGDAYFPPQVRKGRALCRGISSGPDETLDNYHRIVLAALGAAQQRAMLVTPYFIPTHALVSAMTMASLRGVEVTLMLPSLVDHSFMRWAADAYLWQVLEHGVRVVRRPPPFVHTKLMTVDDQWICLGSANLDPRSFRLNFEFNVEAYDASLAQSLGQWLATLASGGEQVTLADVDARPGWKRLRDGTVKLFSPWL